MSFCELLIFSIEYTCFDRHLELLKLHGNIVILISGLSIYMLEIFFLKRLFRLRFAELNSEPIVWTTPGSGTNSVWYPLYEFSSLSHFTNHTIFWVNFLFEWLIRFSGHCLSGWAFKFRRVVCLDELHF
jgi:hypothetical protein